MTSLKNFIKPTITTVNTALWRTSKCTYTLLHSYIIYNTQISVIRRKEHKWNQKRALTCCWLRKMLRLKTAQAAVNKPWMMNTAAAVLRPLLQRQRTPPPLLSKLSWGSFESIPTDGRSEFNCPEKKRRAFYKRRRRRAQTETPKNIPFQRIEPEAVCGGCSSLTLFGLFRPIASIFYMLTSSSLCKVKCRPKALLGCNNNFLLMHFAWFHYYCVYTLHKYWALLIYHHTI